MMSGVVRIALSRPYTFVVLALLILILGGLSIKRTPVDIFPNIGIPVVSAVWTYNGMLPADMSGRVIYPFERYLTATVNDIEHIESQSLPGYGVVKIFFQPKVDINAALSQVTAISQTVLKQLPFGITPPLILSYNAATVPIIQLALSGKKFNEATLYDFGQNFLRPQLATVEGAGLPSPYGGKVREIMVDLDPIAMQSKGVSAQDVENALAEQNLILPAGTEKIGKFEYNVYINDDPKDFRELNNIPIKVVNSQSAVHEANQSMVLLRQVGHVRDGAPPQINIVKVDGQKSVLMTVLKNGDTSTLDIVENVKKMIPKILDGLPNGLHAKQFADQSVFVRAAISGVVREGVTAALLTSLMILLFLGSWRSTIIVSMSIPLCILSSITVLSFMGQTLNVMTLGGLSLAVGILVDDATVMIENINHHLEMGKSVTKAIIEAASQIVQPAFVSTFSICIVFIPMFFLTGVSKYLFVPMAEAVVFAMIASFILSQTFVPTMANFLLKAHDPSQTHHDVNRSTKGKGFFLRGIVYLNRFQAGFEKRFSAFRLGYATLLERAVSSRKQFVPAYLGVVFLSLLLFPFLGRDFFPAVDGGQIKIHIRAQVGTRVESTSSLTDQIDSYIRKIIPANELETVVDNIGLPTSPINLAYVNTGTIGPQDADILISMKEDHGPTARYVERLRRDLPREFPGVSFAFLPADMVGQILNFGSPAPIDIQVSGNNWDESYAYIQMLRGKLEHVPGIADVRVQQSDNYPQYDVDVHREMAKSLGFTERDVTNSLLSTLSGSFQVAPTFWLNPNNRVSYPIVVQTPQYRVDTLSDLENTLVSSSSTHKTQVLGAIASVVRSRGDAVVTHSTITPSFDLLATVQNVDLGSVSSQVHQMLNSNKSSIPKGATVRLQGQVPIMESSFTGLLLGLFFSILLIYLLIVVNFQSWLDPFVIITALPAALAGIVWMLFITRTHVS
ncbi:MAG: efflux RND transporter permease subunit, partial [Betaproteobacteria bacterium]|nr:efflux RND transporter permease subunit [Betaproteobacteria bacterium]